MTDKPRIQPPSLFLLVIAIGAFVACGIYLGVMRVEGVSTGDLIRAVGFGVVGVLILWIAIARHRS